MSRCPLAPALRLLRDRIPRIPGVTLERATAPGRVRDLRGPAAGAPHARDRRRGCRSRSLPRPGSRSSGGHPEDVDAPVYVAEKAVLEEVVGYAFHRRAVALVGGPCSVRSRICSRARRIAACEGITDHENLGSIFRNAAAFGLDAVLLDHDARFCCAARSVLDGPRAPDALGAHRSVAGMACAHWASPAFRADAGAHSIVSTRFVRPHCCVMLGTEGPGLTAGALARAHVRVRITALGVDSRPWPRPRVPRVIARGARMI